MVVKRLIADGHQVLTAADGEAGLKLASAALPDVTLVDPMMPKLHGFGVVEALHSDPKLSRTRIVVCSAKSYPTDIRLAKDAGPDRYLVKPYDLAVLSRTVAELLNGQAFRVKFWGTRDPTHDDEFMDRMVQVCQQRARSANYPFACFAAMEGQVVEL